MFCYIILQHLFYYRFSFMHNKIKLNKCCNRIKTIFILLQNLLYIIAYETKPGAPKVFKEASHLSFRHCVKFRPDRFRIARVIHSFIYSFVRLLNQSTRNHKTIKRKNKQTCTKTDTHTEI